MQRRLREKTPIKPQPLLLLWLMPLLFFSIGGEALHNHSPLPPQFAGAQSAVASASQIASANAPLHAQHEECRACNWAAHAAALSASPTAMQLAQLSFFAPPAHVGIIFCGPIERDSRGPPFPTSFRSRVRFDSTQGRSSENEKFQNERVHFN